MKKFHYIFRFIAAVVFLLATCKLHAQNESLTDTTKDFGLHLPLRFDSKDLEKTPFLHPGNYYMLGAGAYTNGKEARYTLGFMQRGSSFYLDGMELSDVSMLPTAMLQRMTVFSHQRELEHGFGGPAVAVFESQSGSQKPKFQIELGGDAALHRNGFDAEMLLNLPLGRIKSANKQQISLLIAGRFVATNNTDPKWKESYTLSGAAKEALLNQLYTPFKSRLYQSTFFTDASDVVLANPAFDQKMRGLYPYFKLVLPFTDNARLSFSSYYARDKQYHNRFENVIFNPELNPLQHQTALNNYLSWEHQLRIGDKVLTYKVYGQYNTAQRTVENAQHGKNWFDYGYLGSFNFNKEPVFRREDILIDDVYYSDVMVMKGWNHQDLTFSPGNANPGWAAYNTQLYQLLNPEQIDNYDLLVMAGGFMNGGFSPSAYGLFNSPGAVWNSYEETQQSKKRAGLNAEMQFYRHKIAFGFETNHTTASHYIINPVRLWGLIQSLSNFHLQEFDYNNPIAVGNNGSVDTVFFRPKYYANQQRNFDKNLRQALGLPLDGLDKIMVQSWDPVNQTIVIFDADNKLKVLHTPARLFNIGMFSPEELLNAGHSYVDYAGYDYMGNKSKTDGSHYSFFDDYSIPVEKTSFHTAWFSDSFEYKAFKLKLGLRLDAFNANRPVLNDPYLLYATYTAGELTDFDVPGNIGDDFVVYVDNPHEPHHLRGFRDGDSWYSASGTEIESKYIEQSYYFPYLKQPYTSISGPDWTPEQSFSAYKTVVNILPNLSLDYNYKNRISFMANYFAYTVNPWQNAFRPSVFLFNEEMNYNETMQNSALKPVRYDHFTAGTSFLWGAKIIASAYYLQQWVSNYIVPKTYYGAYPFKYTAFANDEASYNNKGLGAALAWFNPTGKGLQAKVEGVKLFAEKSAPNYPEVSDFVVNAHALYALSHIPFAGSNALLNAVFADFSAAVYFQYRHGLPFTRTLPGSISYMMNRPDVKHFNLMLRKEVALTPFAHLAVSLTVENLFNIKNVLKVYAATGLPDDDGYQIDPAFQSGLQRIEDPDAYLMLYKLYLNNPDNFDSGRIGRLSVSLRF